MNADDRPEDENPHLDRPLRSFGRIKARPIKPRQAALMETLLPAIAVPYPKAGPLDPKTMMPEATEVWLEVGFGGGEHMAAQAATRPDALVIGCEPFLNGVAPALRHVEEGGLKNVRIHADDARDLVDALPDASVDRVLILFPDPWHKKKHHKRRIVQPDWVALVNTKLRPGGVLHMATDWQDYAEHMMAVMNDSAGFVNTAGEGGFAERPGWRPETKFERRGAGLGHGVWDLLFEKSL